MTDIVSEPRRKLKQARLPFSRVPQVQEPDHKKKDEVLQRKAPLENADKDDLKLNLSSVDKTAKLRGMIEVKVDVHSSSIQCPEVSTSSMGSDSDEKSIECIDLTSDQETTDQLKKSKMSIEMNQSIDETIDEVIAWAINKSSNENDCEEESKSSAEASENNLKNTCVKAVKRSFSENVEHKTTPDIIPCNSEDKPKKPRRSILDLFNNGRVHLKKPDAHPEVDLEKNKENILSKSSETTGINKEVILVGEPTSEADVAKKRPRSNSPSMLTTNDNKTVQSLLNTPKSSVVLEDDPQIAKKRKTFPLVTKPLVNGDNSISIVATTAIVDCCIEEMEMSSYEEVTLVTPCKANPSDSDKVSPTGSKKTSPSSTSKPRSARKVNPEAQRLKEEREKEKEEKKRQKEEEKLARELKRSEEKRKKEEERLQREEEKRQKKEDQKRLKEEKQKKKQEEADKKAAELEAKRLEKEQREEEKRVEREKREAEKRAKEDEKVKMEEEKKRVQVKQATVFKSFFSPPPKPHQVKTTTGKSVGSFVPFQTKTDMHLAPKRRILSVSSQSALDKMLSSQAEPKSYIEELKSGVIRCTDSTLTKQKNPMLSLSEDGLEIVMAGDSKRALSIRAKLLQFCDNNRPPYYGTWRKKSEILNPRLPFKKDSALLDYEVDSDDEWEDPGEGEDIANSDGEDEGDKEEEDDDGDGFFVPHGYLSDDEGVDADGEVECEAGQDISDQKLKMKQQEFENSFKQKIKILAPIIIGCIWSDIQDDFSSSHIQVLKKYEAQFLAPTPIDTDEGLTAEGAQKPKLESQKATPKLVPDEAIPDLVRLLHGNPHSLSRLATEFQAYWQKKHSPVVQESDRTLDAAAEEVAQGEAMDVLATPLNQEKSSSLCGVLSKHSVASCSPSGASGTLAMPQQQEKTGFLISKTQLNKKMREIGVYRRKENLTRSCWFVLDSVFEKYSLDPKEFPVPCKWDYITFTPGVALFTIPTMSEAAPPSATTPANKLINKFASKVSAEDLLVKSSMRIIHDKEKLAQAVAQQQAAAVVKVDKFATTKVAPDQLLEQSRLKAMQEQVARSLAAVEESSPDCDDTMNELAESTASFVVPTQDAFKSFFKLNETKDHVNSSGNNRVDDVMNSTGNPASAPTEEKATESVVEAKVASVVKSPLSEQACPQNPVAEQADAKMDVV